MMGAVVLSLQRVCEIFNEIKRKQVEEPPVDPEEYALFRSNTDLREPYR